MKNPVFLRTLGAFSRAAQSRRRAAPDADAVQSAVRHALASAGGTGADRFARVGDTIDRALSAAGLAQRSHTAEVDRFVSAVVRPGPQPAPRAVPAEPSLPGEFVRRSFSDRAGARACKVYVPSGYHAQADARVPLVVMLHGCTQSADDFAAGTGMNAIAEQQGFLVAYPEQGADANPSRCWNWFRAGDQVRDSGEPSLIAGMTRAIASHYRIDERRIYIAGLSAGAAMAVVLGATYPELYAAVGAHSGLSYGSAHDVASAFDAMKNGGTRDAVRHRASLARHGVNAVPTIVFHGDSDTTVSSRNAKAIVDQALDAHLCAADVVVSTEEGTAAGYRYLRTVYAADTSPPFVEHWTVRGGGHAWYGGSPTGSYTDTRGPNASREMLRFFATHAR